MDGVEKAFGQMVRRKMREDAEVGVQLVGVAGLKYFRKFFLNAAERLSRDIAAVGLEACADELYAGVGIGNNGLFFVDGKAKFKFKEVLDVGYHKLKLFNVVAHYIEIIDVASVTASFYGSFHKVVKN